jgi:hypothetical protein
MTPPTEKTTSKEVAIIPPARTPARAFAWRTSTPRYMRTARHSRTRATTAFPGRSRRRASTRHAVVTPPLLCSPPAAPTLDRCSLHAATAAASHKHAQSSLGRCRAARSAWPRQPLPERRTLRPPRAITSPPRATSTADASASTHTHLSTSSTPARSRATAPTPAHRRILEPGSSPRVAVSRLGAARRRALRLGAARRRVRRWRRGPRGATSPTGEARSRRQRAEPSRAKARRLSPRSRRSATIATGSGRGYTESGLAGAARPAPWRDPPTSCAAVPAERRGMSKGGPAAAALAAARASGGRLRRRCGDEERERGGAAVEGASARAALRGGNAGAFFLSSCFRLLDWVIF